MSHQSPIRQKTEHLGQEVEQTVYNAAQQARGAADDEPKKLADTADVYGGETWGKATGHSGTRSAWLASGLIIAGVHTRRRGPHLQPAGASVDRRRRGRGGGGIGLSTHVWSDYRNQR